MTEISIPPTQLGKDILRLLTLYGLEMKSTMILDGTAKMTQTTITRGAKRDLEEAAQRVFVQILSEAQAQLLAGKDPEIVLRNFLESRR